MIGVSGYGNCHYESICALVDQGVVQLCAATVINPDEEVDKCAALRANGCRLYTDYRTMLTQEAGQIDLCCIPTGIGWHRTMTVAALKAGMNVLVEKPAAATVEEVEAMLDARQMTGKQVFVGFQDMYDDALWKVKERFVTGKFGRLKHLRVGALWPRSTAYYERTNWAGKLYMGHTPILDSPANNAMAHFIMIALFLAGDSRESVSTTSRLEGELFRAQRIESFDTISVRATLQNDTELFVNLSHSTEDLMPAEIVVETTAGDYTWLTDEGHTLTHDQGKVEKFPYRRGDTSRITMLRHICEHLQGYPSNVCTLAMARGHTAFIEQLHRKLCIQDVPTGSTNTIQTCDEDFIQIPGLSEALRKAHQQGRLLRDVGHPWINHAPRHSADHIITQSSKDTLIR
nr:Gfo/Idh/MocA family oxidoreductase [Ruficoccus amylovorans]